MKHRWSGWPGAWCLDCGCADANEEAIDEVVQDEPWEDRNTDCPEPGSNRHNPYTKRE